MRAWLAVGPAVVLATAGLSTVSAGAPKTAAKASPRAAYFASCPAERTRMRSGPGRTFPATWLYVRRNLPVRVIDSYQDWRKVEDPGGTQGWVLGTLVSSARSAIVTAPAAIELRDRPAGSRVSWRVAPGVVGRISACGAGWCRLDVNGRVGFAETRFLWGVNAGETLP